MGRLIAPSDRSNLDGPFYMTPFDYPFVSNFPAAFDGRDDGAVFWGSLGCGAFKYSAGVFNGQGRGAGGFASGSAVSNPSGDLMFAARAQLDLLDPEPGYYAQDSYFGDKDILAVGDFAQHPEGRGGHGCRSEELHGLRTRHHVRDQAC